MGKVPPARRKISLKAVENIGYIVPHTICAEKDVTLSMRVREPGEKKRLQIGDILTRSFRVVNPSEMLKVDLTREQLGKLDDLTTEVEIRLENRE